MNVLTWKTIIVLLNSHLRITLVHFWFLVPLNQQQAEKRVLFLVEEVDPNGQGEMKGHYIMGTKRTILETQKSCWSGFSTSMTGNNGQWQIVATETRQEP